MLGSMMARGSTATRPAVDGTGSQLQAYGMRKSTFFDMIAEQRRADGKGPSPKVKAAWEAQQEEHAMPELERAIRKEADGSAKNADGLDDLAWY
jgi:hypothetical protein